MRHYVLEYFRDVWNVWLKAKTTKECQVAVDDLIPGSRSGPSHNIGELSVTIKMKRVYSYQSPQTELLYWAGITSCLCCACAISNYFCFLRFLRILCKIALKVVAEVA